MPDDHTMYELALHLTWEPLAVQEQASLTDALRHYVDHGALTEAHRIHLTGLIQHFMPYVTTVQPRQAGPMPDDHTLYGIAVKHLELDHLSDREHDALVGALDHYLVHGHMTALQRFSLAGIVYKYMQELTLPDWETGGQ